MVGDNSDVTTKPEEGAVDHHSDTFDHNENTGETVFDKDSTNLHEYFKRNTERSEAEEGQVNSADGNSEANSNNNEDETTGHAEEGKHDTESNSAAESKSEVNSTRDDMSQNNHAQEENTGEASGTSHDEVVQGDESTSGSGNGNGSDGEGEKKEAVNTQSGSESLPDVAKAEATDDHATGSLPDETGNIPSVHTDNSQNDASENQGDATSATSDSSEHGTGEAVHIETGLEDETATASSGTGSGDDKGNSSDSTSAEENTETASGDDEKGMETGTTTVASHSKEENSENSSVSTEAENSQGDSSSGVNGSSEETSNKGDGATETSNNGEQVDPKIETSTSTNDEHMNLKGLMASLDQMTQMVTALNKPVKLKASDTTIETRTLFQYTDLFLEIEEGLVHIEKLFTLWLVVILVDTAEVQLCRSLDWFSAMLMAYGMISRQVVE